MQGQLQRLHLQQPIRVGLLLNRNSRLNRENSWEERALSLLPSELVRATSRLEELDEALIHLFHKQGINVLAICGGDGTLHHTLNALWRLSPTLELNFGPGVLPPILVLRGGTMNILAGSLGLEEQPFTLLEKFLRRYEHGILGELPLTEVPFLEVTTEKWGSRIGFVLGSSLTVVCLDLYDHRFGGGFSGLWRFLQTVVTGFLFKTKFWQENKHLLEDAPGYLVLDEQRSEALAVVASTIDITLLRGWIKGLIVNAQHPEAFRVRVLDVISTRQLVSLLHRLLLGQGGKGIRDFTDVRNLRLDGDFSLDGELYQWKEEGEEKQRVDVRCPPRRFSFIKPFLDW